ncbi:hypothetical protein [Roseixanthobacter glucoisosaccharinicivorans]|uniref:hypothetical protein n=1 Tax=Roseixanthobacter glucoisosaccharinicivorans TaxID=3119923 RepID=UPI003729A1F1
MVIRHRGTVMSAVAYVERASRRGVRLRDILAKRSGLSAKEAVPVAARAVRAGAGTFENICRGRIKEIGAHLNDALRDALIRELLTEIEIHAAELSGLLADGSDPSGGEVQQVVARVAQIRRAIGEPPRQTE